MKLKSLFVAGLCAAACTGMAAGSAYAGESTGKPGGGKPTPIADEGGHAQSICSFSGQNPERFLDPSDPDYEPGHTQSWGQSKADWDFLRANGFAPGDSCNGHTGFVAQGGGE